MFYFATSKAVVRKLKLILLLFKIKNQSYFCQSGVVFDYSQLFNSQLLLGGSGLKLSCMCGSLWNRCASWPSTLEICKSIKNITL